MPVLVLDEPSSALDAATEAHLWATLRREADAGRGVLLVSHRPSARAIADRVVELRGARESPGIVASAGVEATIFGDSRVGGRA